MTDIPELVYEPLETDNSDPVWETLCELGRSRVQANDGNQWELGDLAIEVDKNYGTNRIGEWAAAIGIVTSTANNYRKISRYYAPDFRKLFPDLSYTHYVSAHIPEKYMADGLEESLHLLTLASENNWRTGKLAIERNALVGKPKPAKRVMDYTGIIASVDAQIGRLVIQLEPGANMLAMHELINGKYRFKVYEEAAA